MISDLHKKSVLLLLSSYILFFRIKQDEYNMMIALLLITIFVSYCITKKNLYDGFSNTEIFTEEEETARRETQMAERQAEAEENLADRRQYTEEEAANLTVVDGEIVPIPSLSEEATDGSANEEEEVEVDSAPIPANTPFVSAEYVKARERARQKDGPPVTEKNDTPDGVGVTDPDPSSNKESFEEKEEVKLTVVEDKFRMGPYDSLCISSDKLKDNPILENEEIITYFGVQVPAEVASSQDVLTGPTVDGTKDAPQKLTMFANNKASINCCGESPFMTSMGCVCLSDNQRNFIRSRGANTSTSDI